MLTLKQISKDRGTEIILSNVSFALGKGEKVALVGPNGVGKTTLLKIIAGIEEADSGKIEMGDSAKIGYLAQDTSIIGETTIRKYIQDQIGTNIPKYRIETILSGFGFENYDLEQSVSKLSSGQKIKIALATILLQDIDILLLDEPTNNLDLPSLIWLEDFIKKSEMTVIVVSHDRIFLDKVTNKIIEIDWQTRDAKVTGGKYSDYILMSIKKLEKAKKDFFMQEEERNRLLDRARELKVIAEKNSHWEGTDNDKGLKGFKRDQAGDTSRRAKAIENRANKMDELERPVERKLIEIPLEIPKNIGALHISMKDVSVGYENSFSTAPISIDISYGNRVGIIGINGSGKSTILKTITGELEPLCGTVEVGSGIHFGNMMQEHETLPRDQTPLLWLQEKIKLAQQDSYAILAKIGLHERQVERSIGELSPGERARLILASFATIGVNTLVLDEPTNHLDLEALQALEETLASYSGTVILVSHDRYFLEKARLDTIYEICDGKLQKIPDLNDYLASAEARAKKLMRVL